MRKLKLQMQMSADGMVESQAGVAKFNWDEEIMQYSIENLASVDCILFGGKTAAGFIPHWKSVAENPGIFDHKFGALVTGMPKVVFSSSFNEPVGPNVSVIRGEVVDQVNRLKNEAGKDMLVYGGTRFVTSLISHGLIDEYHLLVNPVFVGSGLGIFAGSPNALGVALITSKAFSCGTVLLRYSTLRD
jgi:dihydrofolate reductase